MKKTLVSLIAILLLCAASVSAQTYPRATTLSANITASTTVIPIASGTGVEANGALWIETEMIPITSCANAACTRVNVIRSLKPMAHGSGENVLVVSAAARPNIMLAASAAYRVGQCSTSSGQSLAAMSASTALTAYQFLPIFDIDNGFVYMCRRNGTGGLWVWNRTIAQNINGTAASLWIAWP